jgi:hypothetical protein
MKFLDYMRLQEAEQSQKKAKFRHYGGPDRNDIFDRTGKKVSVFPANARLEHWGIAADWLEENYDEYDEEGIDMKFLALIERWYIQLSDLIFDHREGMTVNEDPNGYRESVDELQRDVLNEGFSFLNTITENGWVLGPYMVKQHFIRMDKNYDYVRRQFHRKRVATPAVHWTEQPADDPSWRDEHLPEWVRDALATARWGIDQLRAMWTRVVPLLNLAHEARVKSQVKGR